MILYNYTYVVLPAVTSHAGILIYQKTTSLATSGNEPRTVLGSSNPFINRRRLGAYAKS